MHTAGVTVAGSGVEGIEGLGSAADQLQQAFSAPIDRLPEEIFLQVVEMSLGADSEKPLRDLVGLSLVCRRWKIMVEGSSSLWNHISASEGLAAVRKALRLAHGVPLDLSYDEGSTNIDPRTFFEEIGPHIAQWRYLSAQFNELPDHSAPTFTFAELETTVAPKLEVLHLGAYNWDGKSQRTITLFGGAPQPSTLKDLWIEEIPISFEPLRLSNLTSISLDGIAWVPATSVLQALRESPGLEDLTLSDLRDVTVYPTDDDQPITFLSLTYLRLHRNPTPFTRSILSSITAPSLRFLHVNCTIIGDPATGLLTPTMSHMVPVLQSIISEAENICVEFRWDDRYKINVGHLSIGFEQESTLHLHSRAVVNWLRERMGSDFADLPVTLRLYECTPTYQYLLQFSSGVKVTTLSLHGDLSGPLGTMIPVLSEPSPPHGWLLPELDILETNVTSAAGNCDIVEVLRARHGLVETRDGAAALPKHLLEIRLVYRGRTARDPNPLPDPKFMQDLQIATDGADVYWCGQKWIGSEAAA
ncbi:hypothetical protein FRC05_007806 [Tulasnella sp. 425]|nr:hypothetical protein FRC05_007806 [Tulasnella sp. 425]